MRYLRGTADAGLFLPAEGDETILDAWTDAGFGGVGTRSQSGMFLAWAGAGVLWRSSRQTVSALNTAEAELTAAAMAWQVVEGFRTLLEEWGFGVRKVHLLLDNAAALAITENGASWRTRYFSVRGARIREEMSSGRLAIGHQPTKEMVADGLTKLATAEVMNNLRAAMGGDFPPAVLPPVPTVSAAHSTSVDPGPQNRSDITGDGPAQQQWWHAGSPTSNPASVESFTSNSMPTELVTRAADSNIKPASSTTELNLMKKPTPATTSMRMDSAPPKKKRQRRTGNQREQARWQALDEALSNAQQQQPHHKQDGAANAVQPAADTGEGPPHTDKHKVTITVMELFGEEGSLGLRLENCVIIKITDAKAETLGWRLGDCIVGLETGPTKNQEELVAAISLGKQCLGTKGTPMKFVVEQIAR